MDRVFRIPAWGPPWSIGAGRAVACGVATALLGAVVLAGWLFHVSRLVSVGAGYIAMQPNTALAFLAGGAALALAAAGRRLAGPLAAVAGALGLATLLQLGLGRDLGVDRLLIEPFLAEATGHPGRMAPNTALGFLLAFAALELSVWCAGWRRTPLAVGALGALVFGLGLAGLVSYTMEIAPGHGWLGAVRMAPNTAAGMAVFGAGLVSLGWHRQRTRDAGVLPYWIPGLTGIGVLVFTLFIWELLDYQEALLVSGGLSRTGHLVAELVLGFGIALSAALAAVLSLFVAARRRSAELAEAYETLRREADRRGAAEAELREVLDFNQTIIRESTIGVGVYHHDGRCVLVNDALARMAGDSAGGMPGQNVRELASWARSGLLEAALSTLETGAPRFVDTHLAAAGRETWIEGRFLAFSRGAEPHLLLLANDVSEQRRLVGELRRSTEAAEAASRAKSQFVANMSHEIRTPMNAVVGMLYLMNQTTLTERQADYVGKMRAAANTLLGLINDVLDYSKIEAERLEIEATPFHLSAILDNLAGVANEGARRKDIELVFLVSPDAPDALVGDPLRLSQVLLNITSNAIKYTEAGEVVVTIEPEASSDDTVTLRFTVRDTGIGMTPEQLGRLFSPFTQADSSMSRKFGGSGLGLTISRQLVGLMGGTIALDSQPDRGTTCVFTLPFGRPAAVAAPVAPGDIRSCRALVVDDLDTARESLRGILAGFGLTVTAVAGGAEALAELGRAGTAGEPPYDVVLLDWKMPGMDGFETAQGIKGDPRLQARPLVILVTAYDREQVSCQASRLGLEGFLVKPVTPSMLLDTLNAVLGRAGDRARPGAPVPARAAGGRTLGGGRVLLVEDNAVNRQIAREVLENAGVAVEVAVDGAEAVARLGGAGAPVDAVLMDLHMPVMDGIEATRLIRARPENRTVPIIAMTADAMVQDRQRCLDAGMNDHVAKPIDVDQLFQVLRRWLRPVSTPAGLPGVDVADGLKRVLGRADLYRRLLGELATNNAGDADRIARALAEGDPVTARSVVHALKGAAGNLGARSLAMTAGVLEEAIKAGDLERTGPLVESLRLCLDEVVDGVRRLDAAGPCPTGDAGDG